MKKLFYLCCLGLFILSIPSCEKISSSTCKYDDNGAGGATSIAETNACSCPIINPENDLIPLQDAAGATYNFNVKTFTDIIASELEGTVKGWQLAVGYQGNIVAYDAGGFRTGANDCPANSPMTACTKIRIGSQTKNYVATAIVQLLLEANKDPFTEPILPYLPTGWGANIDSSLTFAHFLGHRNGFGSDKAEKTIGDIESWMKATPKTGTIGDWQYMNANYHLMRIVFPRVYAVAKGIVYQDSDIDTDLECSAIKVPYIENFITEPSGNNFKILNWDDDGSEVLYFDNIDDEEGKSIEYDYIGAGEMVVSAVNMVRYYMALFEGGGGINSNVITSMRDGAFELGFNRRDNTAGPMNEEYFGHGGTLRNYYSCTLHFPGGLVASFAVNSCFTGHPVVGNRCSSTGASDILVDAFNQSF